LDQINKLYFFVPNHFEVFVKQHNKDL